MGNGRGAANGSVMVIEVPSGGGPERGGPERGGPERGGPGPEMFMRMMPLMRALDADGDGTIDSAELESATASLKALDKDQDGSLTFEELRPQPPQGGRGLMPPRDRDGDRPSREGRPGRGPRDGDQAAAGPAGGGIDRMVKFVMQRDEDGDGKVSRDEAGEGMKERFDRLDTDGDDHVTEDELRKAVAGRQRD